MSKISTEEYRRIEFAIRKVFEDGCAAWNRGDLDSYLASYYDSDQIIWISGGSLRRGKAAIVTAYKTRFSNPHQIGKLTLAELEVDILSTSDAFAFGRWMLDVENKSTEGFFTVLLRKIEDDWLFVSDHSSTSE